MSFEPIWPAGCYREPEERGLLPVLLCSAAGRWAGQLLTMLHHALSCMGLAAHGHGPRTA